MFFLIFAPKIWESEDDKTLTHIFEPDGLGKNHQLGKHRTPANTNWYSDGSSDGHKKFQKYLHCNEQALSCGYRYQDVGVLIGWATSPRSWTWSYFLDFPGRCLQFLNFFLEGFWHVFDLFFVFCFLSLSLSSKIIQGDLYFVWDNLCLFGHPSSLCLAQREGLLTLPAWFFWLEVSLGSGSTL